MRVVYDISFLGLAQVSPVHRTGVYRVVERVAHGLAAAGACELAFSAIHSVEAYALARDYMRETPALRHVPMTAAPAGVEGVRRLGRAFAARAGAGARLGTRVARRSLLYGRRAAESVLRRLDPPRGLEGDVFHSPRFELPPPARTGRAARFLTVYDLIPIVHPELCAPETRREAERIVGSLRPGDWALAISDHARGDLCAYRPDLDPARVFVTPLAADPRTFHPVADPERIAAARARYAIPHGPYLLALNAVEPRKNMRRAIEAFRRVAGEPGMETLSFVLVGPGGWSAAAVRESAGPDARRGRVVMPGFVADADLAALYSGATAFVFPSYAEGFGLPPLEAMQCGVPVITSNASSLPEVVGGAGTMVDPDDTEALCQAMLEVCRDAALRRQMRARSLARAARFTWERCVALTLDAYRAALAA
jgi:glycosyltransferase involved in cell wall biosynthesis